MAFRHGQDYALLCGLRGSEKNMSFLLFNNLAQSQGSLETWRRIFTPRGNTWDDCVLFYRDCSSSYDQIILIPFSSAYSWVAGRVE